MDSVSRSALDMDTAMKLKTRSIRHLFLILKYQSGVNYSGSQTLKNSFHFDFLQIKFLAVGSHMSLLKQLIITNPFKYL